MSKKNTGARYCAAKEVDPAIPSVRALQKARKRTPEQQTAANEARRRNEANPAAKSTARETKKEDQKAALQVLSGSKKKRKISLDRDAVIRHACEKREKSNEDSRAPSDERTLTTARDLKKVLRSDSAPRTRSLHKQLCTDTEHRA